MKVASLAFYKGPPSPKDWVHVLTHWAICVWTWCWWSHGELVLNGRCHSSSARDNGVRVKDIDLASGRWDVLDIVLTDEEFAAAEAWFEEHRGRKYDYRNILRFIWPWIGQSRRRFVCFEAIAASLGLAAPHKLTAMDLYEWALTRKPR